MSEQKPTAEAVRVADEIAREWCKKIDFLAQTHEHESLVSAIVAALAAKDAEIERLKAEYDKEIGDFQQQSYELICKLSGKEVDGAGSDAGWADFTLAEIAQGMNQISEQNQHQRALLVEACTLMNKEVEASKRASWEIPREFESFLCKPSVVELMEEAKV